MSLSVSRVVLRQSTKLSGRTARRFQSSTAKATETAKETASKASSKTSETVSNLQSKASEGLSRVSSSAGPAIAGAAKGVGNALGKIGGRTGKFISFVERQIPPAVYYARVGLELSKIVFKGRQMTPPPVATFRSYYQRILKSVRNPQQLLQQASKTTEKASPSTVLNQIRNINTSQLVSGGVIAAELLGFFTVGEIIGRFKLVGYRGDTGDHH